MIVHVRLFARSKDIVGADVVRVELADGACVRDLLEHLAVRYPDLRPLLKHCRLAAENEFLDDAAPLKDGTEVALLPPVSGG
ncbi:MAG: hypothetical protein KatS3mg105_0571 [Gemmatales bacterium]|nr:MAG: hypothetical protein KatS3mg105_0571 [Gemmatales bacterium]